MGCWGILNDVTKRDGRQLRYTVNQEVGTAAINPALFTADWLPQRKAARKNPIVDRLCIVTV